MSKKRTQYKRHKRGGTKKRKTEKRQPDSDTMKTWWKYKKYDDKAPTYKKWYDDKAPTYKKRYDDKMPPNKKWYDYDKW
jgi:hypothetical protein